MLVLILYIDIKEMFGWYKRKNREEKKGFWLLDSKVSCSVSMIPFRFVIFVLLFFHSCWWIAGKLTGHQGRHPTGCCCIHSLQAVLDFSFAFPCRWIGTKLPVVNSQNCISFMIAFSKRVRIGNGLKSCRWNLTAQYCINPVFLANQAQGPNKVSKVSNVCQILIDSWFHFCILDEIWPESSERDEFYVTRGAEESWDCSIILKSTVCSH